MLDSSSRESSRELESESESRWTRRPWLGDVGVDVVRRGVPGKSRVVAEGRAGLGADAVVGAVVGADVVDKAADDADTMVGAVVGAGIGLRGRLVASSVSIRAVREPTAVVSGPSRGPSAAATAARMAASAAGVVGGLAAARGVDERAGVVARGSSLNVRS